MPNVGFGMLILLLGNSYTNNMGSALLLLHKKKKLKAPEPVSLRLKLRRVQRL